MRFRSLYNNYFFRPLSVFSILIGIYSVFNKEWVVAGLAFVSVFIIGAIASSMYPEKNMKELSKGSSLDKPPFNPEIQAKEPSIVGKAIKRFLGYSFVVALIFTYTQGMKYFLIISLLTPIIILIVLSFTFGTYYRFFIEGKSS